MSSELIYRLIGKKHGPKYPGDPAPVLDWLKSRIVGAGWWPGIVPPVGGAYRGHFSIALGGAIFAANDLVLNLPTTADAQTANAVIADSNINWFQPGVWRIYCVFSMQGVATDIWYLQVVPKDAVGPLQQAPGGRGIGKFVMNRGQYLQAAPRWFEHTFTVNEAWKLQARAGGALAAGDLCHIDLAVECLHPLDLPEGQ